MKKFFLVAAGTALLALLLGAVALGVAAQRDEGWRQRVETVPLLVRTQLRAVRPAPELPTPPPADPEQRASLLGETESAPLLPSPTLARPLVVEVAATATTAPIGEAVAPLPEPTATSPPSPTPAPSPTPLPAEVALSGVRHAYQLWNNCGPVTIAMNLSYYDVDRDQREAAEILKPDQDDKNVSPKQLVDYAEREGFRGMIRVGGTVEILQRLISNGYPVIVEDWMEPEDRGGIGHYRLFTGYTPGYDGGALIAQDSYYGPDREMAVESFDANWRVFNRKYIVIFPAEEEATVRALLGPMVDDGTMLAHALEVARQEAQADPHDVFAWFNLGSTYTRLGDYTSAAAAFDEARRLGLPFRMFWYQFEPFEAYLGAGRYQDVIDLAQATVASTGAHEEAYTYQGLAHQARGELSAARRLFHKALEYNPYYRRAELALAALEE